MSRSNDSTSPEAGPQGRGDRREMDTRDEPSDPSRGKVSALLVGVDDQIKALRQNVQKVLSNEHTAATQLSDGEALESLVHSLRQANEHLVIATLDATAREAKTAEAHRQQTLFLSMLAHELRNPLAPIAMSVALLGRMPGTSPAIQNLQGVLSRQTAQLVRLVEDLLDATRITTGKIRVCKTAVLLSQLLAQAIETSQPLLDDHRQTVQLNLPPQPVWIDGDLVRLSQLFSNLIGNAAKFSDEGSTIRITARREAGNVVVSVEDDGIGIAPALQPFVFDLFTQGPVADGKMTSGLGIGLSLVRTIAELHGGTAQVRSEGVGRGSVFTITLLAVGDAPAFSTTTASATVTAEPVPTRSPVAPDAVQTKQILLIDDHPDMNETLGEFLVEAGHAVDCAPDGTTGLHLASLRAYDVICCDIGLPDMDGLEVARQLHQRASRARLIAISGYGQQEHRDRALTAGFAHYLVKPVWVPALLELIDLPARASR